MTGCISRGTALLMLAFFVSKLGLANLQVFPTRIILTDKKRVEHLSLRLLSKKAAQYRLSAIFYRMKPDGSVEVVQDAKEEERSAEKYVRFSPRQVTLVPNIEQIVRVRLSGPRNLADGEYRAHLRIEPLAETEEGAEGAVQSKNKINMRLEALIAVAIPIIYRHGKTQFTATLSNLKITRTPDKKSSFSAEMTSEGNAFPYGDLELFYIPKGGSPKSVEVFRGVASFLPKRSIQFPISIPDDSAMVRDIATEKPASKPAGKFRLEFHEPQTDGKDGRLISAVETQ